MLADCRRCKYFVPREKMTEDLVAKATRWVETHRPGEELLGWCRAYKRPVTYYTGRCYRFSLDDDKRQLSLEQFIKIKFRVAEPNLIPTRTSSTNTEPYNKRR